MYWTFHQFFSGQKKTRTFFKAQIFRRISCAFLYCRIEVCETRLNAKGRKNQETEEAF